MLREQIKEKIFRSKYRLYRNSGWAAYQNLLRNQSLSRDELDEMNWEKRKALLEYVYEKVPYYKKKYSEAGLQPGDIKNRDDWTGVPFLSKSEIRNHFREMLSTEARRRYLTESTTGGSTGEPLKVMFDKRVPLEGYGWRMLSWWGIGPSVNTAFVWRRVRDGMIRPLMNHLLWWPTRRIRLDASSLTEGEMQRFVQKFNTLRPPLLQGYVGAIDHLASCIEENRWDVPAPKAIWVTSSPVSAVQRRRIERIFGAPVYDQYGCGEVFWLAAQCGARGDLHINHEGRFIEFVDPDGHPCPRGQTGRILITDLDNRLFPLIRYENGDQGRSGAETCPCGINLPLMDQVNGRTTDMIRLPDRSCISGDYLTTIFDKYPDSVKGFQVRQEADYSLRLLYVPQAEGNELEEVLRKVNAEVRKRTQEKVAVTMEAVETISHAGGKLRYVTSAVGTADHN